MSYCHSKACSAWGACVMRTSVPYETKLLIWIVYIFLNRHYQSEVRTWGGLSSTHISWLSPLPALWPHLLPSFCISAKKLLVGYSRMNWGCDYMTDMSSIMLLYASLHKSWTMFSHQFLRWVPDAISNAGRLTEEQRQRQRMSTPKLQYPWNHWQFNPKVKVPS